MTQAPSKTYEEFLAWCDEDTWAEWVDGEVVMRLAELRRGREPDLLFIAKEHLDRLTEAYLDGPADLVVGIVSPESGPRDRGEKYYEYEAAGVREYWLIDPDRQQAEFYRLNKQKRYELIPLDAQGIYRSEVIAGLLAQGLLALAAAPAPRARRAQRAETHIKI